MANDELCCLNEWVKTCEWLGVGGLLLFQLEIVLNDLKALQPMV